MITFKICKVCGKLSGWLCRCESKPRCASCGGPHEFDTSVNSDQWNAVIRAAGLPDFLCLTCIIRAFACYRMPFDARLYGGVFSGASLSFNPQTPNPPSATTEEQP